MKGGMIMKSIFKIIDSALVKFNSILVSKTKAAEHTAFLQRSAVFIF